MMASDGGEPRQRVPRDEDMLLPYWRWSHTARLPVTGPGQPARADFVFAVPGTGKGALIKRLLAELGDASRGGVS